MMAPDRAGAAALGIAVPVLLVRMRRDFDARGGCTRSTATAMWGCYGIGGALYVHALLRGRPAPDPARAVGLAASAAGVAAVAAGMGAFNSAAQLTGTDPGTCTNAARTGTAATRSTPGSCWRVLAGLSPGAAGAPLS
jgi:hypothetical protein